MTDIVDSSLVEGKYFVVEYGERKLFCMVRGVNLRGPAILNLLRGTSGPQLTGFCPFTILAAHLVVDRPGSPEALQPASMLSQTPEPLNQYLPNLFMQPTFDIISNPKLPSRWYPQSLESSLKRLPSAAITLKFDIKARYWICPRSEPTAVYVYWIFSVPFPRTGRPLEVRGTHSNP